MDASRLERAARALLDAASRIEAETMCVVPRRLVDALRAALAAQPAQAGEAVAFVPWRVDPQPDVFDDAGEFEWCVETDEARPVLVCTVPSGVMRPQSAPGASHASFATANQIVADHNAMRGRPLPSAETASAEVVASVLPLADGLLRDAEDAIAAHAGPGQHVGTPKVTVDALRLRNVARAVAHALRAKGAR